MRTFTQNRSMQMCAVLALAALMIFVAGPATAAYNQRNTPSDQTFTEQQEQEAENVTGEDIDRPDTDRGRQDRDRSAAGTARNLQLERQIASQLRSQGYGQAGQIMILATGNKVILLGNVPDNDTKKGAAQIAKQAASGAKVDDRLHVVSEPKPISDAQLQAKVTDRLSGDAARAVQVQAQNGTVVLQGHLNNWTQAADAIDAAFAAGAQQVNSRLTVGAGGYYPSYGYTPGAMGGRGQAVASDLRLAQQVAQQLQQQLPPGQNVETIQPQSIYVMVQQGTVTLHGYVVNTDQKQQAEQIVRSVQGVQNINNDLAIFSPQGGMAGPGRRQQGGAGGQRQWDQSGQSGMGNQDRYGQTTGQGMAGRQTLMSDRRLAQTIQQQLQSQFPGANINVQASQGTVTLQGSVADSNQRQQAEQFAYSIPGVQNVQNNLTVGGQGSQASGQQGFGGAMSGRQTAMSRSDLAIARQVAQKLQQQLGTGIRTVKVVRPGTIYVMARQGTVMLHGFAVDQNVTQQVTQIARSIPGVRNVQSMLNTGPGAGGFYPPYGYVPGQEQQGQMGQPGAGAGTNTGVSGRGGNMGQSRSNRNTGSAQFSQSAYSNQSGMGGRNTGTRSGAGDTSGQPRAGSMGAEPMPPMPMSASDLALAQHVAQKLQQQLPGQKVQLVQPDTIYIVASQGTVWLHGYVADTSVKQHASQIAQSVTGVNNVKNMLSMSSGAGAASALGYIPGQEDESADQQFGNEQFENDQFEAEEDSTEDFDTEQSEENEADTSSGNY